MTSEQTESPELQQYRMTARAWIADNLVKIEVGEGHDEADPGPDRIQEERLLQERLYRAGYVGFTIPVDYGGLGLTPQHERIFLEEARSYRIPGQNFGVSINIIGATLAAFGTEEQKRTHLPRILSGRELWMQLLSEPSGGSDLAGLLTTAVHDGDHFVVNGQKIWSTGAHLSDFALCPVRTRWDVPKHRGISVLLIDLRSEGLEIRRILQIDGRAELCQEFLTEVVVPASNLVGRENEGWRVVRGLLEFEHAWVGRGDSRRAIERQGVQPIVEMVVRAGLHRDQGVRRAVVSEHVASKVQELVAARVSDGVANGKLGDGSGSLLKLGNDTLMQRRAELALRLAGGAGVVWNPDELRAADLSTQYLNSRSSTIQGGTVEIQRNNVSERVLGLPREPVTDRDIPFDQVPHN